jgi:hypothetical protein
LYLQPDFFEPFLSSELPLPELGFAAVKLMLFLRLIWVNAYAAVNPVRERVSGAIARRTDRFDPAVTIAARITASGVGAAFLTVRFDFYALLRAFDLLPDFITLLLKFRQTGAQILKKRVHFAADRNVAVNAHYFSPV